MNEYRNTEKDIHTRIYKFTINCFREVVQKIPKKTENLPIISQIASSLTSIGANDKEADATGSTKDFLAKYQIVKKETNETLYWLSFIRDTQLIESHTVNLYLIEGGEILKIISKIIYNIRNK